MNTSELRNKSIEELQTEQMAKQRELFNLRMQKGLGQVTQTHLFRNVKKAIARIKTLLREKQGN